MYTATIINTIQVTVNCLAELPTYSRSIVRLVDNVTDDKTDYVQ